MGVDDTAVLEAVRECDPATAEAVADRLSVPAAAATERLESLAADGRLEREAGEEGERWRIARDPRIDGSVERMTDRLGSERPDRR